jgi:endonuclease/exonuclease/phosphatase family metal-dependent hydrolase
MNQTGKWYRVVLGLAGFLASAALTHAATVTALNFEWFPGKRPQPTQEEIDQHITDTAKSLAKLGADIFIATEVCDAEAFRISLNKASPDMELHVISNFSDLESDADRRNQQIAIASRLPAVAGWAEAWIPTSEQHRRGFAFAALKNPATGGLIMVYGLHLKSNRSGTPEEAQINYDIRNASAEQLIKHAKLMEEKFAGETIEGWILAGDINTNHDGLFGDQVVELFNEAGFLNTWKKTPPAERFTWKGNNRFSPGTLDYIFLKGFGDVESRIIEIPGEVSDHNAVSAIIQLKSAE